MKPSPNLGPINNPVTIQDIVVIRSPPKTGESGNELTVDSLSESIKSLVVAAANIHKNNNFKDNLLEPGKENNITRLITSEFSFYTKTPLSLEEFTKLQNSIADLATTQPENLHLVLSSFAVKTPENQIMNVVAHVECGQNPKLNFILKNNTDKNDPAYNDPAYKNKTVPLKNLDIKEGETPLENVNKYCSEKKLLTKEKSIHFNFSNVIECTTKGGAKFNTCIDIGSDHKEGEAQRYFKTKWHNSIKDAIKKGESHNFPLQCSHVVTSKNIAIKTTKSMGIVTHADPSHKDYKGNTTIKGKANPTPAFGSGYDSIETEPLVCSKLSDEATLTLKWQNTLNNFKIKEKYKGADVQKSLLSQLRSRVRDRSTQLEPLKNSLLKASKTIEKLQNDNDPFSTKVNQKKLSDIIDGIETTISLAHLQMGVLSRTSRMGKVLDELNLIVQRMKDDVQQLQKGVDIKPTKKM